MPDRSSGLVIARPAGLVVGVSDLASLCSPIARCIGSTPVGVFQMSKADFYRVFPKVSTTQSYKETGLYHYPRLPAKAERFRVHAEQ